MTRRIAVAAAAAAGLLVLAPGPGLATSLPQRTFQVTTDVKGPGTDGAVSMDGSAIALISGANVYVSSVLTGASSLVSVGLGGAAANGPSSTPAISGDGTAVAFASTATNLTTAGGTGTSQIYARGAAGTEPVSVAADGGLANGPSSQPAISVDGRYVAFASTATDLVPGDGNGASDIFVRDRLTRTTIRASVAHGGVEANGPSTSPAISGNGRVVSFASAATNLVGGGRGGGVFVRIPSTDATELVSLSTRGQPQNAGVTKPFTQISSLSLDGRLVAFDSNATNLVSGEDPRPRTNVFVRDRRRHTTTLISQDNAGYEGNNDSFAPFITPSGLYVAFESFARNLGPGGGPRENVFVRDVNLRTTSVVNVTPAGGPPGPEIGGELLERPTLSTDGSIATFTSTAARLTGDASGVPQVFLRLMTPPRGFLRGAVTAGRRPQVRVGADDPGASSFECRIDLLLPFACPPGRVRLPLLTVGRHQLQVRAGGPGMLYDPLGLRVTLRVSPRG